MVDSNGPSIEPCGIALIISDHIHKCHFFSKVWVLYFQEITTP